MSVMRAHEGRLSIVGGGSASGNGVQVKNSTFGPGGCSDGIQDSSSGTEIGPNNEFKGIVQGGCSEHADAIQPYASNYIYIHDNYLHDNEQGIMSPDGVCTGYRITNNVIHTADGLSVHASGRYAQRVGDPQRVPQRPDPRLRRQSEPGQPDHGRARQRGGIDALGVLGLHHRPQPVGDASDRRLRALRLCHRLTEGHRSDGTDIGLNSCSATQPPPPPPPSDTTAPDTTITSARPTRRPRRAPRSPSHATESGSTFQCRLDSGAYAACASPKAYSALSMASHTFSVRATDAAGNVDATPAMKTWTVQSSSTPPPSDHQPVAAYTATPTSPTAGKPVRPTPSARPAPTRPAPTPGRTTALTARRRAVAAGQRQDDVDTFQEAGVKNVRLNVTDADGERPPR